MSPNSPPSPSSFPLSASSPIAAASDFLRHHLRRIADDLSARLDDGRRLASSLLPPDRHRPAAALPFAALSAGGGGSWQPKQAFDVALAAESVAKTLAGTSVFTVGNSNNEFVLISDPASVKSLGLLCFRQEDAESLLAQVQLRQPVLGKGARVVPITLDQVYMLKVEGIAFRFLPDPTQIRNALELKVADTTKGFDGVPIFQSDLLVVKKKSKRYYPVYFRKEDIERELSKTSKALRGSNLSQHIMVGCLEDVLKKMEMSSENSGWDDLVFIPPGKSYLQHFKEVPV